MAHLDPERLSAYIDAELSPDDMQQVERHLAECETCRHEFEELRGISDMVRELPTYLPRRTIEIDASTLPRESGTLAQIVEFGKPLAVAALILLVAFAGLQLLVDNDDDGDSGEEGQISFSAVQEQPTPDETIPENAAFEPPMAEDSAPDAAMMPARQVEDTADTIEEDAADDSEEVGPEAQDTAERETVEATISPAAPDEEEPDDDGGTRYWLIGALVVITIGVALSAARYALRASPKGRRQ